MCGVFDIANYGDHLFPAVLRSQLKQRGVEDDVVLFSPFAAQETFVDDSRIYSLEDMEKMHNEDPFSAIVVGGGEIIHWYRFEQKMQSDTQEYEPYPMAQIWLIPWSMKEKYGIPLIWNAPGIPFNFPDDGKNLKSLFSNIDYLSVRNEFSVNALVTTGIPAKEISLVPDTGFALQSIATPEELAHARNSSLPFSDPYVVFHCNRFIPPEFEKPIVDFLLKIQNTGRKVVFLPLAYTHGDDEKLLELNKLSGNSFFMPPTMPSLVQIIAILSGCELYVGTSLHGSVTAAVFGKPTVAFDYQKTKKTRDLYQLMNRQSFYCTSPNNLDIVVQSALQQQNPIDLSEILSRLTPHFDTISKIIMHKSSFAKKNLDLTTSTATLIEGYLYNTDSLKSLEARYQEALKEKENILMSLEKITATTIQERANWLELQQQYLRKIDYMRIKNIPKRLIHRLTRRLHHS
jgi:polysaccharide pyruvyl transferase WcaK-like protein